MPSTMIAKEISAAEASLFWESCQTASVFCKPVILGSLFEHVVYFAAFKGEEMICVWPVPLRSSRISAPNDFAYYLGPYFRTFPQSSPAYKTYANQLRALECLIPAVLNNLDEIRFSLLPTLNDIRPFLWWNYNYSKRPKFKVEIKYTARLDDLQRTSDDKLISMFRRDDKRKKIKRFLKDKEMFYEIDERASVKKLIEMFDATIKRSNGGISERAKSELKFLLEFAQSTDTPDSGWLVVVKSKKHEEIAGYQLVLSSKDTAYAVAQCSSDFYRDSDLNIFLTYKSITMARDFGFDSFDFNGANSPNRADDKHAFGAAAQTYFELIYDGK